MVKQHRRPQTMADIAAAVRAEQSDEPGAADDPCEILVVEGRRFTVAEADLTPVQALELAVAGALVVYDPCGCGGGCGYDLWQGPGVRDLVRAGAPRQRSGRLRRITDSEGRDGVLAEWGVGWGPLR